MSRKKLLPVDTSVGYKHWLLLSAGLLFAAEPEIQNPDPEVRLYQIGPFAGIAGTLLSLAGC